MVDGGEPTPGEIGRRLDLFQSQFNAALTEMKTFFHSAMAEMKTEMSHADDSTQSRIDGIDSRLRTVEQRPVVTPKSMWAGIAVLSSVCAAMCTALAIVLTIVLH